MNNFNQNDTTGSRKNKSSKYLFAAAKRAVTLADKEKMKSTIEILNKRIADWEIILKN